jgi:hypothetical protein
MFCARALLHSNEALLKPVDAMQNLAHVGISEGRSGFGHQLAPSTTGLS